MNEEMLAKARTAKSAEELREMAKEDGFDLTEEKAKEVFQRITANGEMSDDELDAVSGGGCGSHNIASCGIQTEKGFISGYYCGDCKKNMTMDQLPWK